MTEYVFFEIDLEKNIRSKFLMRFSFVISSMDGFLRYILTAKYGISKPQGLKVDNKAETMVNRNR